MTLRILTNGLYVILAAAAVGCQEDAATPTRTADVPLIGAAGSTSLVIPCAVGSGTVSKPGLVAPSLVAGPTVNSATLLPPISGGTMLTTAGGSTIVASDPDRDQIYFVDSQGRRDARTRKLNAGDQPGRVVEDAAGRIHVVLRAAHAIATLGRDADSEITRREVCALPRGIAYDAKGDQLHIACAEGKLVTLPAAPTALMPTRTIDVPTDVRDVLVRDDKLFVSRFRSAELLVLDAAGKLQETHTAASLARDEMRRDTVAGPGGGCKFENNPKHVEETPDVAWRMIDVPQRGVTLLHQRAHTDEIQVTSGGYGAAPGCGGGGIVKAAITLGMDTPVQATASMGDLTLAVDIASDSEGKLLAVVAPGNYGGRAQLELLPVDQLQLPEMSSGSNAAPNEPNSAAVSKMRSAAPCVTGARQLDPQGQATAVTFVSSTVVAVQQREPAAISFFDVQDNTLLKTVTLDPDSRFDTGHAMFHMRTSAGLACASCHPEGGDDGHVWTFATIGPRRTQTLRGGILGTEPLHWNGDMKDFNMLMSEVFVGRMSGFAPSADQTAALTHWLDSQPALHADATDKAAAERGKALFESAAVGCASCHSGAHLTNNATENVGTGASLQVPSLKGVRFRTPLMHDGCAASISDRLTKPECGGGDQHGKTSQLSDAQLTDLRAYLETL